MEPNNVKSFICYDLETKQILAFIRNDYTTIESANEVFQEFSNFGIVETELDVPSNYIDYKVNLTEDNTFESFEFVPEENKNEEKVEESKEGNSEE